MYIKQVPSIMLIFWNMDYIRRCERKQKMEMGPYTFTNKPKAK